MTCGMQIAGVYEVHISQAAQWRSRTRDVLDVVFQVTTNVQCGSKMHMVYDASNHGWSACGAAAVFPGWVPGAVQRWRWSVAGCRSFPSSSGSLSCLHWRALERCARGVGGHLIQLLGEVSKVRSMLRSCCKQWPAPACDVQQVSAAVVSVCCLLPLHLGAPWIYTVHDAGIPTTSSAANRSSRGLQQGLRAGQRLSGLRWAH